MMNYKYLKKYIVILTGFLVITSFIWFKFLRTRVPRELPLTLLVLSFLTIICSIMVYGYITYRLYKPNGYNKLSNELSKLLFIPLEEFNHFFIQWYNIEKLIIPIYSKIKNVYFFYFITDILPRIITLIVLIIDVFYIGEFHYIYNVIYVTLIPLFSRYFIYSLNKLKNSWITLYSSKVELVYTPYVWGVHPDEWPENQKENIEEDPDDYQMTSSDMMCLPLNIFVDYQSNNILFEDGPVNCWLFLTKEIQNELKKKFNVSLFSKKQHKMIDRMMAIKLKNLINLSIFITTYKQAYVLHKYLRDIKALIYLAYFVLWSYVLYICAPKVLWITGLISLLHTLILMEYPFSGNSMFYDFIIKMNENEEIFI